jgi:hypothetical protein
MGAAGFFHDHCAAVDFLRQGGIVGATGGGMEAESGRRRGGGFGATGGEQGKGEGKQGGVTDHVNDLRRFVNFRQSKMVRPVTIMA